MMNETLLALLQESVDKAPNSPYGYRKTDDGWQATTFTQLQQRAQALAAFLHTSGWFSTGDKVSLLAQGSPEWVIAELGLLHARLVAVPLSMKLLPEELTFRVEHSESRMIACSALSLPKIKELVTSLKTPLKVLWLDDDEQVLQTGLTEGWLKAETVITLAHALQEGATLMADAGFKARMQALFNSVQPNDLANICYSSGTTGNPKGVMISHRNYAINATFAQAIYNFNPGTRILLVLPIDHAFGHIIGIYMALYHLMQVYFVDVRAGMASIVKAIPENMQELKPDLLPVVPALINSFMKKIQAGVRAQGPAHQVLFNWALKATIKVNGSVYEQGSLLTQIINWLPVQMGKQVVFPRVRKAFPVGALLGGGALIDRKTLEFFHAIGVPLNQCYGMTEASPLIAGAGERNRSTKLGALGPVCAGLEGAIMRSDGTLAYTGEKGEIVVKGPTVMLGYFKNPTATAETLRGGWLHTGDLGTLDKDGFLSIMGREKALLINNDGEKFSPEEIEEAMLSSPVVEQVLLYCDHHPYTVALVTLSRSALQGFIKGCKDKARSAGSAAIDAAELLKALSAEIMAFKTAGAYKKRFPKFWLPSTFALVKDPLELNSTLKMVRHKVIARYQTQLDFLFSPGGRTPLHEDNLRVLTAILKEEALI